MEDSTGTEATPNSRGGGPTKGPTRRAWNSTLPAPSKPMSRGKPIRKRNPRTGGKRFPKRRDEAYRDWIRTLPCCLTGCVTRSRVECAHVRSRGAGGDDVGNCVPLCRSHHDWQHRDGIKSFQAHFHVDLAAIAADLATRYPGAA